MTEILGLSNRRGLGCRAPAEARCTALFCGPQSLAAAARDAHEQTLHGYFHVIPQPVAHGYGQSRRTVGGSRSTPRT